MDHTPRKDANTTATIEPETLIRLYRTMLRIRTFEEKIVEVYPAQEMKCPAHLCTGQEAIAAGVIVQLRKTDYVFSNHRNHGHCIAKGSDIRAMMAELYGRATGHCRGKGGSMHMVDPANGILGTSAIVGGGLAHAVGAALASAIRKDGRISVAFFGDGASEQGTFHESLNFAALRKLPVVFVCENNYYATNSPLSARQPDPDIYKRARGYGIPAVQVDGNDVRAVYRAARPCIDRARSGGGPSFLECGTYRWKSHVGPEWDYIKGCRPKEELDAWMARCPVESFGQALLAEGCLTTQQVDAIKHELSRELDEAVAYGRSSPVPAASELTEDLYHVGGA